MAHYILYLVSLWLVVSPLYRGARRIARARAGTDVPPMPSPIAVAISLPACIFIAISIILAGSIFFQGGLLRAINALALAMLVSVFVDGYSVKEARRIKRDIPIEKSKSPLIFLIISAIMMASVLHIRSMPGSRRTALKMKMPFQGSWRVITGGRFRFMNYHHGNPPTQNSAVDFVAKGPEGASLGRPLFAPVDGLIIRSVNDIPDSSETPPEGNIIIIRTDNGADVWMAHLQKGSVKVKEGERVQAGQEIAACGGSGGADVPHLHLHAEKDGRAVPMLINGRYPVRGDFIHLRKK